MNFFFTFFFFFYFFIFYYFYEGVYEDRIIVHGGRSYEKRENNIYEFYIETNEWKLVEVSFLNSYILFYQIIFFRQKMINSNHLNVLEEVFILFFILLF